MVRNVCSSGLEVLPSRRSLGFAPGQDARVDGTDRDFGTFDQHQAVLMLVRKVHYPA